VKLRYLHRNPVKRGLVSNLEDWKWSSYRHYAFREIGIVEIELRGQRETGNRRRAEECLGFSFAQVEVPSGRPIPLPKLRRLGRTPKCFT